MTQAGAAVIVDADSINLTDSAPTSDPSVVVMGDMLFRRSQISTKGAATRLWTDGVVVYEFDDDLDSAQEAEIAAARSAWTAGFTRSLDEK
jgi:hypothetical protein